jgi:1,4-alpha-glucan branching enzyme
LACEIQNLKILSKIQKMKLDFSNSHFPLKLANGVYFAIQNENAFDVHIVGDFNNWKVSWDSRLNPDGFGGWRKFISLKPGTEYHYKYLVDGEWEEDHNNPDRELSPYGGFNSKVELE